MSVEAAETQNGSRLGRAKHALDDTVGKTREQLDQARERFQNVADKVGERLAEVDVNERLSEVQEEARRRATRAKEVAQEQYEVRSEQLKDGYAKVQDNVAHASDDLGTFVRENPGRAVLIAAGAGFLIGLLFRGASRRD